MGRGRGGKWKSIHEEWSRCMQQIALLHTIGWLRNAVHNRQDSYSLAVYAGHQIITIANVLMSHFTLHASHTTYTHHRTKKMSIWKWQNIQSPPSNWCPPLAPVYHLAKLDFYRIDLQKSRQSINQLHTRHNCNTQISV